VSKIKEKEHHRFMADQQKGVAAAGGSNGAANILRASSLGLGVLPEESPDEVEEAHLDLRGLPPDGPLQTRHIDSASGALASPRQVAERAIRKADTEDMLRKLKRNAPGSAMPAFSMDDTKDVPPGPPPAQNGKRFSLPPLHVPSDDVPPPPPRAIVPKQWLLDNIPPPPQGSPRQAHHVRTGSAVVGGNRNRTKTPGRVVDRKGGDARLQADNMRKNIERLFFSQQEQKLQQLKALRGDADAANAAVPAVVPRGRRAQ